MIFKVKNALEMPIRTIHQGRIPVCISNQGRIQVWFDPARPPRLTAKLCKFSRGGGAQPPLFTNPASAPANFVLILT